MIITVKVLPGARETKVVGEENGVLKIKLTTPPDKGKANLALIDLLSEHFKLPKRCIVILSGHTSRIKTIEIDPNG